MTESTPYDHLAESGCGPLRKATDAPRNLKQQLFEAVRASGHVPRVELARSLGISPASVASSVGGGAAGAAGCFIDTAVQPVSKQGIWLVLLIGIFIFIRCQVSGVRCQH